MPVDLSVSVIIVTRNRPGMVRDCLEHLRRQTRQPEEVIVVDSSTGEETRAVLEDYPEVMRLRIPDGQNNRPQAKNLGIAHAHGSIVAFLDDDSMTRPNWLCHLLEAYSDSTVGGVGGRVVDVLEQTRVTSRDPRVGVWQHDGTRTTNFFLDTRAIVEVDHMRGCNMSFRRLALQQVGGFDPLCLGSNVCEEPDLCLRIKKMGWKLVYQPLTLVDHLAAPREDMARGFGVNESVLIEPGPVLWSAHNLAYLYFKNFGFTYWTIKHILGGMQVLYLRIFLEAPSWPRFRAMWLYGLGSWWGLLDSLRVRLHQMLSKESTS